MPKFELDDADGNIFSSTDLRGKKYVIYFYPKDFTPGCTIESDEFYKDYKKFQNVGIDIVCISNDDVDSHKKFCEKMKIPYVLLADTKTTVSKLFGVWGKKKFMGREYMGINRSTFLVNENGKIFKVFEKVKAKGHSKEVLEAYATVK
mgnify:CR=1 FL=1